jgi:hypothetical protein
LISALISFLTSKKSNPKFDLLWAV